MRKRDYYWSIFKKAFGQPLERADLIAGVIGLVGGAITYFFPSLRNILDIGVWLIPISILIVLSAYRLILAPYWIYSEEWEQRTLAEKELSAIYASIPHIIVDQFRESPLFRDSSISDDKVRNFNIIQVWFRNNPEIPTKNSEAKRVTA